MKADQPLAMKDPREMTESVGVRELYSFGRNIVRGVPSSVPWAHSSIGSMVYMYRAAENPISRDYVYVLAATGIEMRVESDADLCIPCASHLTVLNLDANLIFYYVINSA